MKKVLRLSAWVTALAMTVSTLPVGALAAPWVEALEQTNTIVEGEYNQNNTMWYASFNDLEAEADYIVIVSRTGSDPLEPGNLVYLQEAVASETGLLTVPFRAAVQDIGYVVACRPGKVLESHMVTVSGGGTADPAWAAEGAIVTLAAPAEKDGRSFLKWTVEAGGVQLADTGAVQTTFVMGALDVAVTAHYAVKENPNPSTPKPDDTKSDEPSSGDGDGGDAVLLVGAGVAAAAVAVGIVTATAPVEVKGKVELEDHTLLANAHISLLQEGKVVAQTTADANGIFGLKVKRGNYELTAVYTDANGQMVYKTVPVKAPVKDLTITF